MGKLPLRSTLHQHTRNCQKAPAQRAGSGPDPEAPAPLPNTRVQGPGDRPALPCGCPSQAFDGENLHLKKKKKPLLGPVKTHPVCRASGAWAVQTDLQFISLFFNHFSTFIGIQLSQVSGQCQPGLSSMLKSLYPLSVDEMV